MLRNSASKILAGSRLSWQLSTSTNHPYRYSKRANGSLSHLWSSAHEIFVSNREESNSSRTQAGIPRISLAQQQRPLSLPHQRSFFSTSATEEPQHTNTFRERMEDRRDRGREAASKGAHSLSEMVRRYGAVFVGTYFTVYVSTLGVLFLGIESGVLDPAYVMSWVSSEPDAKSTVEVVTDFMGHYPWTRPYVPYIESNPEVANLAVAWIAVKFTEPIRFGTTVAIVPRLSRYLGYAPPKDSPDFEDTSVVESNAEKLSDSSTDGEG
eukprot:CAMPEP_0176233632 /NCGR_PEP_ID=MMETSP0121_2-20121125/25922_1 /TAXON_ID=160619 /ORGANISM="Kryptoperidinium foliaceum, Strain CCMP 1326" /LENGTH=266 /DNA_ID=CAMNT_0017573027 /DNA_START=20 /DNA_END=817 /DNA_ORIENTATION=+